RQRACRVDLAGLDVYDAALFHKGFFNHLARQLDAAIERWHDLEREAAERPLALVLDEFGHLSGSGLVVEKFVSSVHYAVTCRPGGVTLLVCVPSSIEDFLKGCGLKNPKYHEGWSRIHVGPMDEGGVDHLLSFLPPGARYVASQQRSAVARLSRLHPC